MHRLIKRFRREVKQENQQLNKRQQSQAHNQLLRLEYGLLILLIAIIVVPILWHSLIA
ncbi:hypothetical protein [Photobacterium sanguinicancri]|uniref:Uncharacterized protein n=1 Tax=Photobacterium sanguinicancri TaxID=875932 RepID=A0AAW7Y3E3_9GAMM|nr:hypothetical protein [Photobacterium sanguinicancri]MDO6499370.1 hypothetical protein [Photobacterium sanguinicancri]MDO6543111.1 hypothetical protein [Photobacterium sanguinicancri]